jgi:hypothetical protein
MYLYSLILTCDRWTVNVVSPARSDHGYRHWHQILFKGRFPWQNDVYSHILRGESSSNKLFLILVQNSDALDINELSLRCQEVARVLSSKDKDQQISINKLRFFANLLEKEFPKLSPEEEYLQLRAFRLQQRNHR